MQVSVVVFYEPSFTGDSIITLLSGMFQQYHLYVNIHQKHGVSMNCIHLLLQTDRMMT